MNSTGLSPEDWTVYLGDGQQESWSSCYETGSTWRGKSSGLKPIQHFQPSGRGEKHVEALGEKNRTRIC